MREWKKVQGSQKEKPVEFDTATSAVVVYQRRNVELITLTNQDGSTAELWEYDEREMTYDEYINIRAEIQQEQIDKIRADIDFLSAVNNVDLSE